MFSTFFLFGKHHPVDDSGNDIGDDISELVDDIFGDDDPAKKYNRQLAAPNTFDTSKPHLLIKG